MTRWTALLTLGVLACSGDDATESGDTGTPFVETPCTGLGDPVLEIGTGGSSQFVAYSGGETVDIEPQGAAFGLFLDLSTTGLNTAGEMSALIRYDLDGKSQPEQIANLLLQCGADETGWTRVFLTLADDEVSAMALEGSMVSVSANLTDNLDRASFSQTGTAAVDLMLAWPL